MSVLYLITHFCKHYECIVIWTLFILVSFHLSPIWSIFDAWSNFSRWKMLAWGCGLKDSMLLHVFNTLIIGHSANMDVQMITTLRIISLLDKCSACGTNYWKGKLSVATCEGGRIVLLQITCTFKNCLPVFKSYLEFIIQLSILKNVLKTSLLKLNIS